MTRFFIALTAAMMLLPSARAQMHVDSFDGPVTATEIGSFSAYVQTLTPATDNIGNNWAQGKSGEQLKAMSLMYEVGHDIAVLNRMLVFCDAVLSQRNDLAPAPVGQHVIWTGGIDPVWPNDLTATPIGTGGEQGDPVGHLGNCARLILVNQSAIGALTVPDGDPHGYGATYLARAQTYVAQADFAIDNHILKSLLNLSDQNHQHFSTAGPYQPGNPVPWNQQMMFNYGFQNLAICHTILGDNPVRAALYDGIMQASINWFFGAGVKVYTDAFGNTAYNWGYAMPSITGEDSNHGSLDVAGIYREYVTGRYGITAAMMIPFGNVVTEVMWLSLGNYSGRVDGTTGTGHGAATTYIRSGYLLATEFRPDAYRKLMSTGLTEGGSTGSIDGFSRCMYVKNRRAQGFALTAAPAAITVLTGAGASSVLSFAPLSGFSGGVGMAVTGAPPGTTATVTPTSLGGSGSATVSIATTAATPAGTYTLVVIAIGISQPVTQLATITLTVTPALPPFALSVSPASQIVTPGGNGTYTVAVTAQAGSGPITLGTTGLPASVTAVFTPATLSASGTSSLKVSAGATAVPGNYPFTVTGASSTFGTTAQAALLIGGPLPLGWSDLDIGAPSVKGYALYSSGVFSVGGNGADVQAYPDQFHFAFQPLSGDMVLTARVASQTNTNGWAKAGVMIRQSTASGSLDSYIVMSPGNGGDMQSRYTVNSTATDLGRTTKALGLKAPYWVRLVRLGNTFTGYTSADGAGWNSMTTIPATVTIPMTDPVLAGLGVSSHVNGVNSLVTFDNVAIASSVAGQMSVARSGLPYSRVTLTYNGSITVTNVGTQTISGPFQIVLTNLYSGAALKNASGITAMGTYITVPGVQSLAPGQSAAVAVQFTDPSNAAITYTPVTYAGRF